MIRVQQQDFDVGAEIAVLRKGRSDVGAIAAFVGLVRDHAGGREVTRFVGARPAADIEQLLDQAAVPSRES